MAWIIGCANAEEVAAIKARGFEVCKVSFETEAVLFAGDRRRDDPDAEQMVMVYVDSNIPDVMSNQWEEV